MTLSATFDTFIPTADVELVDGRPVVRVRHTADEVTCLHDRTGDTVECDCAERLATAEAVLAVAAPVPSFAVVFGRSAVSPDDLRAGVRASADEVIGVAVVGLCAACLSTSTGPTFAAGIGTTADAPQRLRPLCTEHAVEEPRDPAEIEAALGVPIVWAAPSHPLVRRAIADWTDRYPEPPFPINRRYVVELAVGEVGHTFAEHLRVDADGNLWTAPWARAISPVPGQDVPVTRDADGRLVAGLAGVTLRRPIRGRQDDDGFVIPLAGVGTPTVVPAEPVDTVLAWLG